MGQMKYSVKNKIENSTKVIINSPKNPYYNEKRNNYNTFCTFKSIDDIYYLVYIVNRTHIIFYNLIDERKVIDIDTGCFWIYPLQEIKYLFDENNKRDLLFSLSEDFILKLWNVNNFECLFNIKIKLSEKYFESYRFHNHLGFMKLENKSYNIIVTDIMDKVKIFDLNGKQLNADYRCNLKIEKYKELIFMDTYYEKKSCKNYIFFYIYYSTKKEVLCIYDYQKKEIYKEYPEIYHAYEQIIINDNNENLIKMIYLINYNSIGIFNFHSGDMNK